MKKSFNTFLDILKGHFLVFLLVFLIAIVSFIAGIEVQKAKAIASLEAETVSELLQLRREISNISRSEEKGAFPSALDVVVLRNSSANIRSAVLSEQIHHKTSKYPNALTYLMHLTDTLQGTKNISFTVQQYTKLLTDIPMNDESGLYDCLESLEIRLATAEGQAIIQELQQGNGLRVEVNENGRDNLK